MSVLRFFPDMEQKIIKAVPKKEFLRIINELLEVENPKLTKLDRVEIATKVYNSIHNLP